MNHAKAKKVLAWVVCIMAAVVVLEVAFYKYMTHPLHAEAVQNKRFQYIENIRSGSRYSSSTDIYVDTETGVEYIVSGTSATCVVNPDGSPHIHTEK